MIRIVGGKKYQKDIAQNTIKWCINYFNLEWYDIDIDIEICKYKTYKCWGTCVDDDEEYNEFHITIANDQSLRDFVATITHEMVHVKQFARNEMDDFPINGRHRWKLKTVPITVTYYDMPWEREALRLQEKLTDKFWKEDQI